MALRKYIVVSPVKDEEKYVETTLISVIGQTHRPSRWIIVDDGSTDATPGILDRYAAVNPWITVLRIDRDKKRRLGIAEVRAFEAGYQLANGEPHDFVVKLDCDVELPLDYFERLLAHFELDSTLGITSGGYRELRGGQWVQIHTPAYHAPGASKTMRVECYRQIGGFVLYPGWDTVDEIKARALGWKTCHFEELSFRHLKPEGSGSGYLKIARMCGQIDYVSGVGFSFSLAKGIHRMIYGRPFLLAGCSMLYGFLSSALTRKPMLVTPREARLYRQLLHGRVVDRVRRVGLNFTKAGA